ncbi:nitroreductase family protein [Candidatus Stoquefichus massiliensis]|uniref:nitroreductase family protein n=1 Tax=Candidatus Stoquefichus massiliensis TaxID=1470350 RepID=UPI000486195E|nr:nitroreductase family protein [Candidatus Stoquefichus massiliensis]
MEFNDVIMSRRSIRKYLDKQVSEEDLQKMIEAAILAPSWKNSQVTRYYIAKSHEVFQQVKEALPEFNQNNAENASVLIISTIVLNRSGFERDGTPSNELGNGWGYYDCGMHNMNLVLKATELGLSTLVMGIRDAQKIKNIFDIPDNQSVVSVIAVGYSDFHPDMPKRKCVEDITTIR